MGPMSRRKFLGATAWAAVGTVATPALARAWKTLPPSAGNTGYFEHNFGISDSLCRKILDEALAKGGDWADLFFEHRVRNWLSLEDGKVSRAAAEVALGVGIRCVEGDQIGYGFTQQLDPASMLAAARTAATIANQSATRPAPSFRRIATGDAYPLDQLFGEIPVASKVQLVQSVNENCFARSPLIIKVTAQYHDEEKRILVVSSDGAKAEDLQPKSYLTAMVVVEKDKKRERAGWGYGGRRPYSFYTPALVDEMARKAVDRSVVLFDAVKPPAGEVPVVLGPGVTGVLLHEAIGHGMEADFNRKKISTYATMIGRKVAEPSVTIVDDGTLPNLIGSINFDDEGTPSQRTVLVDQGILTSYLHDKISALHYGVKPTGSGRRESYQHYVQPRMRNTFMLAGSATPEDAIRQAGNGIYVEDVSNGQVNIGEGDFAFYVSQGRMIENGKLTAPIKDINIMGNGPKMLANMALVANDLEMSLHGTGACGKGGQAVPCGFGQPTVLVQSLTVGGVKS
jgi:TldD protein